jgi:hypothetical protein
MSHRGFIGVFRKESGEVTVLSCMSEDRNRPVMLKMFARVDGRVVEPPCALTEREPARKISQPSGSRRPSVLVPVINPRAGLRGWRKTRAEALRKGLHKAAPKNPTVRWTIQQSDGNRLHSRRTRVAFKGAKMPDKNELMECTCQSLRRKSRISALRRLPQFHWRANPRRLDSLRPVKGRYMS